MAKLTAPLLGKKGTVDLDETVFGEGFHMALVHEASRAELNARRQGTHSTLTRGEVAMTTAKAFRQKGTGRARAGALSTPQRTGGGVAFGPTPRHYTVKVNRKARRRAMRSALSVHAERGSLAILDVDDFSAPATKQAAGALGGFRDGAGRALVVLAVDPGATEGGELAAGRSFRNLPNARVVSAEDAGVADVIGAARLVVSRAALDRLVELARPLERRQTAEAAA